MDCGALVRRAGVPGRVGPRAGCGTRKQACQQVQRITREEKDVFDDEGGRTWRALGLRTQRSLPENKPAAQCAGKRKSPAQVL